VTLDVKRFEYDLDIGSDYFSPELEVSYEHSNIRVYPFEIQTVRL
jgi:hypothetical protein